MHAARTDRSGMTKLSIPGSLGRESVGARNKLDNVGKATFLADVFDCRVVPAEDVASVLENIQLFPQIPHSWDAS